MYLQEDFLNEYLKEKQFITLTESKKLMILIEADEKTKLQTIKDEFVKKAKALWGWKKRMEGEATIKYKEPGKLKKILIKIHEKYLSRLQDVKSDMIEANKDIFKISSRMKTSVQAMSKVIPMKGKIAIGATAAAATALAGHQMYKKHQHNKEILPPGTKYPY